MTGHGHCFRFVFATLFNYIIGYLYCQAKFFTILSIFEYTLYTEKDSWRNVILFLKLNIKNKVMVLDKRIYI